MRYYTVHAPAGDPDELERLVFVKDGFCWPALFFPLIWMLWRRLWLMLVWYVVFLLVVAWVGRMTTEDTAATIAILGTLLFAFEGNNFRRLALRNRGWEEIGATWGANLDEAEVRFIARRPEELSNTLDRREVMLRAAGRYDLDDPHDDGQVLGLFPEPERSQT